MSTLADIRGAIAAQLTARIPGLYVYGFATDNIHPPAVVVHRPELVDYLESFNTADKRYVIPLKLIVQRADAENADDKLDELLDSVSDAISSDPTLADVVASTRVTQADTFGIVEAGEVLYLACDLHLEVLV